MPTLEGSPIRSTNNAFLERYVKNVSPEKPLQPLSPSKVNSSSNIGNRFKDSIAAKARDENALEGLHLKADKNSITSSVLKTPTKPRRNSQNNKVLKPTFDPSSLSNSQRAYYEFLCRVGEVKRWIEEVTGETLPSELDLCVGESLRNGVYLAMLTQKINPELAPTIYSKGEKLQFKHTQNINAFFSLVDHVGLPESFRFELQDLYNKKDLPQVFETLYILITIINKKWPAKTPAIGSLSGELVFSQEDLRKCQRTWPRIRDFKSLSVSPTGSPFTKKADAPKKTGLIKDFGVYEVQDRNINDTPTTPTSSKKTLEPPQLSPPSETRALFSSRKSFSETTNINASKIPSFKNVDHNLMLRTPHLEYSPLKNSSLSYYSPTISKYLTYDTDFYMRRSQAREKDLEFYQSHEYGPIDYSPRRKQKMTELEFLENVIRIQGLFRAVNVRFELHIQKNLLRLFRREIIFLQSLIRTKISKSAPLLGCLQSSVPGCSRELSAFQSLLKGLHVRKVIDASRMKLLRQEQATENLQRYCHGILIRKKAHQFLYDVNKTELPLKNLQSIIKGAVQRSAFGFSLLRSVQAVHLESFQSFCRSYLWRKADRLVHHTLDDNTCSVVSKLQGFVKGKQVRRSISHSISLLEHYNELISSITACIQGKAKRHALKVVKYEEFEEISAVDYLQGMVRGVLVRYALDLVDDVIEYNYLHEMQATLKGYLVRHEFDTRSRMFQRNARSIITIQSKIRMTLQRKAYLELMECPNPTIRSVRKFCRLLNNIGTIEEAQNELEGSQAQLDSENSRKEKLERDIRQQLDMIGVLESYDLCAEFSGTSNEVAIPKRRYPTFEKLFYLLQVDPSYWTLVYTRSPDFFLANVYVTFSTVNQRMGDREKMLFIRLLVEIIKVEISAAQSVKQFIEDDNAIWMKLLRTFLQREYPEIFTLFMPLLKFISNPQVQFESNPSVIYKNLHGSRAMNNSTAVEDQRTSAVFIENLRNLWHAVELLSMLFSKQLPKIPLEIRQVCTKLFCSAADKNADETETLEAIAVVLVRCFSAEFLYNRSHYGYSEGPEHSLDLKIELALRALTTVFSGSRFSDFYEPLNAYAQEIGGQVKDLLFSILLDPQYEQECEYIIYEDMISMAPQLEILGEKVVKITSQFQESLAFFPDDDVIHDVLNKRSDSGIVPPTGRVVLDLAPTVYRFLVSDDRTRKVYDQVKRAFIYMMQIEDVNTDLYDLVLSCVLPQDEPRFQGLVKLYGKIQTDPIIQSLSPVNYFELKNSTLKKIHELENMGTINPSSNRLQNFLNDIANTIKNPHYAIDYVTKELYATKKTLDEVNKINSMLERTLSQQKKIISKAFQTIQQSRSFEAGHRSTLGNLKDAYKKVQHKKARDLEGLKFKWTTRQLYEKGVIKSIAGERLGEQKIKVFGSSGPRFPDINFKISTSDGVKYGIQLLDRRKGPEKRHSESVDSFGLKDLLACQVGSKSDDLGLFNGKVHVSNSALLSLVVSAFLRTETQM